MGLSLSSHFWPFRQSSGRSSLATPSPLAVLICRLGRNWFAYNFLPPGIQVWGSSRPREIAFFEDFGFWPSWGRDCSFMVASRPGRRDAEFVSLRTLYGLFRPRKPSELSFSGFEKFRKFSVFGEILMTSWSKLAKIRKFQKISWTPKNLPKRFCISCKGFLDRFGCILLHF